MKKVIKMNHIGDTLDKLEKFIREETRTPEDSDSDYLGSGYYIIVDIVRQ
jgi:hypothetical protein